MNEKYIAFAIPIFFLAIAAEAIFSGDQRRERYRFADSITSLSCGVGQQVIGPLLKTAVLFGYLYLYEHARLFTVSERAVVGWAVLLFGVDLAYYWFHRASHRINVLWATHVVHHQSEEYNLSTALRQPWLEKLFETFFYLPLAVLGFSPAMFVAMSTLNTLYQFWIHTRAVKTMPRWFEWLMNTPSHHRVHHGVNPKYLDKNYGGIFIIWDRLFGTFEAEEDEPVYGIVKPLGSYNPLWANVHYFVEMWTLAGRCPRLSDRVRVWVMPPDWRPRALGGPVTVPDASRATQKKYDPQVSRATAAYVAVHFVIVAAATAAFLWFESSIATLWLLAIAGVFVATLISWGALLEGKRWAWPFEIARVTAAAACVTWIAFAHGVGA